MTFIKSAAPIAKPIIVSSSSISSKFVEMKTVRQHLEYEIIQKILDDHKDFIIPNLHDLSFDLLIETFATFALLTNHINKFDIFELIIYEQTIFNNLSHMN